MRQQRGFTLIELIIVIVILGILAVTAAPRFIDLQSDARASTLEGVKAALQGGSQLVYAKSAIAGEQAKASSTITLSSITNSDKAFAVVNGFPSAAAITSVQASDGAILKTDLNAFAELSNDDFTVVTSSDTNIDTGEFGIVFGSGAGVSATSDGCYLKYADSTGSGIAPVITIEDADDC